MSTENQVLKLMPYARKIAANGTWIIEAGDEAAFEVPGEYRSYIDALEKGISFSKLADVQTTAKPGFRFQSLKRFLLFLDDHGLIADRDYRRLADSLRGEYTWPSSIFTTPLVAVPIFKESQSSRPSVIGLLVFLVSLGLSLGSLFLIGVEWGFTAVDQPSHLVRSLVLFLVTLSLTRIAQALVSLVFGWVGGRSPGLDLLIEPLSIRLRTEQRGRVLSTSMLFAQALTLLTIFGVAAALGPFAARTRLEYDLIVIAASFAFFIDASPYSRSFTTDLLRSLYAKLQRGRETGGTETVVRRAHVIISATWILCLGLFLTLDVSTTTQQLWSELRTSTGNSRLAGYALCALIALFVLNWIADILGSISYDDASSGQVRRLWRRRSETALEKVQGVTPSAQDLEKLPFLRQIPEPIRKQLITQAQVRLFKEGQAICRQGDKDRNLFVVLEGRLAVAKTNAVGGGRNRRKIVAWLEPGAVFGENAFFFGHERTADVIAMDAGRVLILPHSRDMKIVEADRSQELRTRIWFLQALVQNQLFRDLPSESLDSILHAGVEQRFTAGQKVIQEGEQADACYFMVQGRANVAQKTKAIAKINAGDAFGEISILFPGTLRTATITAETDLITIKIERDRFWKLLRSHLPLALEIERLGLRRLREDQARNAT